MIKTSKRFVVLIIYPFQVAFLYNLAYHYFICKCTPQCKRLKHLRVYNGITPKATLVCSNRWGVFCDITVSYPVYGEGSMATHSIYIITKHTCVAYILGCYYLYGPVTITCYRIADYLHGVPISLKCRSLALMSRIIHQWKSRWK